MWSKPCIVVALMAGLGAAVTAQVESVGVLLQKGIYQEETIGDLIGTQATEVDVEVGTG